MTSIASSFGLQQRLILIALVAFVPALLFALYTSHEQRQQDRAAAEEQAAAAVQQVAAAQSRVLGRAIAQAETLADVPTVRQGAPEECSRYLARVQSRQPDVVDNITRVDRDGRIRCSALPIQGEVDVSGYALTRQGLASLEPIVGDYVYGIIAGHGLVTVTAPILAAEQRIQGIVVLSIDLGWLRQVFARADVPPGTQLTLLDRQGVVVARFPGDEAVGQPTPESAALLDAARQRPGGGPLTLPGQPNVLYEFYRLPGEKQAGPLLYAAVPVDAIYGPADSQLRRNLLGLLLALVATLAATGLASRRLVLQPVQRLGATAQRLAAGDLAARVELGRGRDEITGLGQSFDRMATALQGREHTLRERQEQIERLNRVYAVLSGINSLIIRAGPREALLSEACRIAVDSGGFALAWIGLLDDHGQGFASIRAAGEETPRHLLVPVPGDAPARRPEVAPLFENGRPLVYPPPDGAPYWRTQLAEGYARCVALPLRLDDKVIGCMALYAHQATPLDAMEKRLLSEMAADISHALHYRNQAEQLAYISTTDPLTALPNAARFRDGLRLALRLMRQGESEVKLAVMLVAVRGLRDINAVHGLGVGDQVLRASAVRLAALLPAEGTLARLRSGVFGISLPVREQGDVIASLVRSINDQLSQPVLVEGRELTVDARIGISLSPTDAREADSLLQHAETALHGAAASPERFCFFIPELQRLAERRLALEGPLHQALERDELYLLYQPVVSVRTRRLLGVEALIRWRHPERGEVSPGEFVPVAEAAGLMVPLGRWALETAFRQARAWASAGIEDLKVAVNVSASQLKHPEFMTVVDQVIAASGADPRLLQLGLELTETELMEDAAQAERLLGQLKARGFALSIDDFGTGYSSLAYLKRFPLDVLKIDIAFVRDVADNPAGGSIVQAIIALAHALELTTVAEGVETLAQFQRLAEYGCDSIQGHLFGRAMDAEAVARLAGRPLEPVTAAQG